jgi:hypothetical protein
MQANCWYMVATPFASLDEAKLAGATINQLYRDAGFTTGDVLYFANAQGTFIPRYWIQGATLETSGWSTRSNRLAEDTTTILKPGQAVYIKKTADGVVTFSGAVKALPAEFGLSEGNAWAMVTPIWPEGTKLLNDFTWTGVESNDVLYRLKDGNFVPRYWIQGATPETSGWSTRSNRLAADTTPLAVGEGVYINKKSSGIATVQAL